MEVSASSAVLRDTFSFFPRNPARSLRLNTPSSNQPLTIQTGSIDMKKSPSFVTNCSLVLAITLSFSASVHAEDSITVAPKIAWFGTWQGAITEAKRSGRPIFLVAAAPHCHYVSGIW